MRLLISVCQASLECLCTIVIFYWIIIIKHKTQINFSNNKFFLTSDSTKYNLGFYGFGLSTHVEVYNNCKDHKKLTRTESWNMQTAFGAGIYQETSYSWF